MSCWVEWFGFVGTGYCLMAFEVGEGWYSNNSLRWLLCITDKSILVLWFDGVETRRLD